MRLISVILLLVVLQGCLPHAAFMYHESIRVNRIAGVSEHIEKETHIECDSKICPLPTPDSSQTPPADLHEEDYGI